MGEKLSQVVAATILADVATLGSERMVATIGKASLRDAAIGTGIAVDKMLALTGQMPALQIANIVMPSVFGTSRHNGFAERRRKSAKIATPSHGGL
jgi:hypothetical protein